MSDSISMRTRIGHTPLVRARKLENKLGIGRVYLKLEGNNPSGHREDRMAYLIIRDALAMGKNTITMGTYGTAGGSLAFLAQSYDVRCVVYVPSRKKVVRKVLFESSGVEIVEHGKTYEDCVEESRRAAQENGWYDANPGFEHSMLDMHSFWYLATEIHQQLDEQATDIFCQVSNGSSVAGLHLGAKHLWVAEEVDQVPRLFAASTSHGNAIVSSFESGSRTIMTLDRSSVLETKLNRHVVNAECFNGQDALNAIHDTGGKAIGISDGELKDCHKRFRKLQRGTRLSVANTFPLVALEKEAATGSLAKSRVVVILNDGRVDVEVRRLDKSKLGMPYVEFLKILDDWLTQFSDPLNEIRDAADDAFTHGFVLGAYHGGDLFGIAVVSTGRYEAFFPKYHLSYIATKKTTKGMGIATLLIEKVIELTRGDFSLHVETDNPRAIKLYEKMGLRRKYYRMFYQGPVAGGPDEEGEA